MEMESPEDNEGFTKVTYNKKRKLQEPKQLNIAQPIFKKQTEPEVRIQRQTKLPPLVVYNVKDHKTLHGKINTSLGNGNTTFELRKNTIKINCLTKTDLENTKEVLKKEKLEFYGQTPKDEKPFSVIIKNLSDSYESEDVMNALIAKNINVTGARRLQNFTWLIIVPDRESVAKIRGIKYLLGLGIKTEKYRGNKILQCKNCQRFGHLAINCNMAHRCVKCTKTHLPGKCELPAKGTISEPMTVIGEDGKPQLVVKAAECVNCGGPHPANYSQCEYRLKIMAMRENRSPRQNGRREPRQTREPIPTNFRTNVSYSSIARATLAQCNKPQVTKQDSPFTNSDFDINTELKKYFNKDLTQCMDIMHKFRPYYNSLQTHNEKKGALIQLLAEICLD
jgi:hypothetical protein